MKKIWKAVVRFFEMMARARAAGVLVRAGEIEAAKNLYRR